MRKDDKQPHAGAVWSQGGKYKLDIDIQKIAYK